MLMKRNCIIKRATFALLMMLIGVTGSYAYDFEADGIYYNITENSKGKFEAEVTFKDKNYNSYSGNVVIPESVTYEGNNYTIVAIGKSAFRDCIGLTGLDLPESVQKVAGNAFNECSNLRILKANVSIIGEGISFIKDPTTVSKLTFVGEGEISADSYKNFANLAVLNIGDGVTKIGEDAFKNCKSLVSVTFGLGMQSIGEDAFSSCKSLRDVYCNNEMPPLSKDADVFNMITYSGAVLHVPASALSTYQIYSPWSRFKNIEGF